MVGFKTVIVCFLFAFVFKSVKNEEKLLPTEGKSFECAAVGGQDASEDERLSEIIRGILEAGFGSPKVDLKHKFDVVKSNFADSEELNADLLHAFIETFEEKAFMDQAINQKFNFGKAIDKAKTEIKEGLVKAKNSVVNLSKKAWEEIKIISSKCVQQTMSDMKKFPNEVKEKFFTCSNTKMNEALSQLAEVTDINALPLSGDKIQEQLNNCLNQKDNTVQCLKGIFDNISKAVTAKMPVKEGEENPTTILQNMMNGIMGCANMPEILESGKNKAINSTTNCVLGAILEKIEGKKEGEAPAAETSEAPTPAPEAPAAENSEAPAPETPAA